jgi:adenosine deaminase
MMNTPEVHLPDQDIVSSTLSMPKVDLHRHLEGSLRVSTLQELARQGEIDLPLEPERLQSLIGMRSADRRDPQTLLTKFQFLRRVYVSPELIQRVVREVVEDAAADQVIHLELRFSPRALAGERDFPEDEVINWVVEAAQEAASEQAVTVRLIASVNRHEPLPGAEKIAAAVAARKGEFLVGFDLAGDEESFRADPFLPLFREVKQEGLYLTVHAGEWSGADAVRQAIEDFGVDRIGHGVRVGEDSAVAALARERAVPFEVCPGSNIASGIVSGWEDHPVREMIVSGLYVTLNSDNPGILSSTLSEDLDELVRHTDLSVQTVQATMLNAARAAFLSAGEKKKLEDQLLEGYQMGV